MTKKEPEITIDYEKPIYINSFNADELIFNVLRKTSVKAVKYDGSIPVSLDALKIKELVDREDIKGKFGDAFYQSKDNLKTFCDVVINVNFSEGFDFTDVDTIRKDADDERIIESLKKSSEHSDSDSDSGLDLDLYSDLLTLFRKNRKSSYKIKTIPIKTKDLTLRKNSVKVNSITLVLKGTRIIVKIKLTNKSTEKIIQPLYLYLCRKDPDKAGEYNSRGRYVSDEVVLDPKESKTIKAELDIRSVMVKNEDKPDYIVNEGVYRLLLSDDDVSHPHPIASLKLREAIIDSTKILEEGLEV